MAEKFEDIEVRCGNPDALDSVVQQLGAAAVINGSWNGETCKVRCFGGCSRYVQFAIAHQGYGTVVQP